MPSRISRIKLSLCSKKVSTQIYNSQFYYQKVIIGLDIRDHHIEVYSENIKDAFEIINCSYTGTINNPDIEQYQIEGRDVHVISFAKGITAFWKNHQEGFLSVIRHLLKIFRCKFSISNNYNSYSFSCAKTISELFNLQVKFKRLSIRLNGSEDRILLWNQISSNFGLVENLTISSVANPGFRPVFTSWPQKIDIPWCSDWFSLDSLLACACTTIRLGGSHFCNKDLDEILRKWKTGGFQNLKCLKIYSQNIRRNGTTILGLNLLELRGKVIRTDDGSKKAKIKTGDGKIEISVTPVE
ncbi:hypothetical protein CRE_22041 [Caenorhabditis remanei]|uniref:Sdz-33 F-box domain-containing protein n=1 Tax=Caenorhabditis remanei TaxID=31234 RepID=E3N3I4_CAERE|nr:hypothetical protein CRE_22041 [Caenorhabditis remanei]